MNGTETVEGLKGLKDGREDPSLEKVKTVLQELENPQKDYDIILVGGTNGKGSTTEFTSRILREQGLKVGKFKSPHLKTVRERIQIGGNMVSRQNLAETLETVSKHDESLSFFETLTVTAYEFFSTEDVDVAVMEVGMGGKLDATNAADPDVSVITNVKLEHQRYLGGSRKEIGREIAGIIGQDTTVVTGTDNKSVLETAEKRGAEVSRPIKVDEDTPGIFRHEKKTVELETQGSFQKENIEAALSAARELTGSTDGFQGLDGLGLKGRFETVSENPLYIQDGAHNPAAVRKIFSDLPSNCTVVFGAVRRKDTAKMIEILEDRASEFIFTRPGVEWSEDPEKLDKKTQIDSRVVENPARAEKIALEQGKPVVATGSLYLVGDLKQDGVAE